MAENYRYWTGWIQAQVVAFGGVAWLNECGFLCWGMVHADHGGNGCGRQLLAHRIDTLQSVGVKSIFSDTSQLTEGFFARHGFQAFYREPEHFGPGIDLVGMELSLDGTVRGPSRIQPDNLLSDRLGEFA
jgi:GNAT superfamily N-acetyltransferase